LIAASGAGSPALNGSGSLIVFGSMRPDSIRQSQSEKSASPVLQLEGKWWKMVEDGGKWWKMVENGSLDVLPPYPAIHSHP